ncbi:MAG: DUF4395 domain-containing protein [Candidatus Cohnella colombiensis]|uniref:DUF4395 domain-containing protein n=1 Tax=Candidatus Cohnella colombiensis TaxID=3121368 RepID=A0AA95JF31_9BACL|nr:MAG: DUF4395 domain-containing protein [Cohnella sp.]
MKEVPMRYVKSNQTGIVLFVVLSFLLQQSWILPLLLLIQVVGLLTEGKYNVFVLIAKRFITNPGTEMQAVELQRFNNVLAIIFLTLSILFYSLGLTIIGTVFALMLLIAAGVALLGYCIGCTIYFQYKQLRAKYRT